MSEEVIKYFAGELNANERVDLLRRAEKDQALMHEFISVQNDVALIAITNGRVDVEQAEIEYGKFIRKMQWRHRLRRIGQWGAGVAAMIAVVLTTLLLSQSPVSNIEQDLFTVVSTPAGQRANIVLHDGTEVWLNAQSTLRYAAMFTGDVREVELEGEAYFHVASDMDHPFVVTAGGVCVEATGTKFNVHGYKNEDYVRASLIEGRVNVYREDERQDEVVLSPGEEAVVDASGIVVTEIRDNDYFNWRDGVYAFDNEPVLNILKSMEHYYDITVTVNDPSLFMETYTGKFRQSDSIDDILYMLQKIKSFKVEKEDGGRSIYLSR